MTEKTRWELLPTVKTARVILIACFFLSGMTGLLYEVVWVKLFTLVFGNTVYSTAAVLGAFMGGLGAGGWWFGRFIEKRKDAVKFYGIVEIIVGVYAFVPPFMIRMLEGVYPSLYTSFSGSIPAMVAVKAAAAILVLVLPTFCMGATLPLLSRFFISKGGVFGRSVSLLYGLNTLGAVIGTFLTGFILIRFTGVRNTLLMGMVINIGIGLLALVQHRKLADMEAGEDALFVDVPDAPAAQAAPAGGGGGPVALVLGATFCAGFVSMLLEVAWTRAMALILGSSVYAFSIILITFLLGIALGSFIIGRYFKRTAGGPVSGLALLGFCFAMIAVTAAAGLPMMQVMVFKTGKIMALIKGNYYFVLVLQFVVSIALLLLPTLFFGAAFPAAAELYNRRTNAVSSGVGRVYFWNTLGAIFGSILTGFALIPVIGVGKTLALGIFIALAVGVVLMLAGGRAPFVARLAGAVLAAVITAGAVNAGRWDNSVMSSGPFIYMDSFFASSSSLKQLKKKLSAQKILYYGDGVSCTVAVLEMEGQRYLRVNGKTDASTAGDRHTQAGIAAFPLLVHGSAKDIAIIGMGSGMTSGVALQFPTVRSLDLIEIEPKVVEGARYFDKYNFNSLKNPKMKVHLEDGRNYMLGHEKKYDVIISEPSNHWIAGVANLFTKDFFELAASRLNEGGIYCQWIQLYSTKPQSMFLILRTLRSVFPNVHLFLNRNDIIVVSSKEDIRIDAMEIARRFDEAGLRDKFDSIGVELDRYGITLGHYAAGPEEVRRLSAGSDFNTDDRPVIEYTAPFELFSTSDVLSQTVLMTYPVDVMKRLHVNPAALTAGDYFNICRDLSAFSVGVPRFEEWLQKAVARDPYYRDTLAMAAAFYKSQGKGLLAEDFFRRALDTGEDEALRLNYVNLLIEQKMFARADAELSRMAKVKKENMPRYYGAIGQTKAGLGDYRQAIQAYLLYASVEPDKAGKARAYLMAAEATKKMQPEKPGAAMELLAAAYKANPEDISVAVGFARSLKENGDLQNAYKILFRVYQQNPKLFEVNIMLSEIQQMAAEAAAKQN